MKNYIKLTGLCLFFLVIPAISLFSQTAKDIFNESTPITWLGIDFTQAKVYGETATDATKMRDQYFPSINNNVNTQTNHYDIQEALHRSADVNRDLSYTTNRNKSISVQQIKTTNAADYNHLKLTDMEKIVQPYSFTGKSGIGLLFVVDGMSKSKKAATIWVVFINMTSKKVLLAEKIEGKASGFGFSNYWAKPVESILEKIKSTRYNEWKKKYT